MAETGKLTVFTLTDAGYANLKQSASAQSFVVVLGIPIRRDGVMECKGRHIESSSKKVNRVARSTLAAETIALSDAIDTTLWFKTIITEMHTGVFTRDIVLPTSQFPLMTPFKNHKEDVVFWSNSNSIHFNNANGPQFNLENCYRTMHEVRS